MSEIVPKTLILRCNNQSFYRDLEWMTKNTKLLINTALQKQGSSLRPWANTQNTPCFSGRCDFASNSFCQMNDLLD